MANVIGYFRDQWYLAKLAHGFLYCTVTGKHVPIVFQRNERLERACSRCGVEC